MFLFLFKERQIVHKTEDLMSKFENKDMGIFEYAITILWHGLKIVTLWMDCGWKDRDEIEKEKNDERMEWAWKWKWN